MVISQKTDSFLNDVELFTAKTFRYRKEIEILLELSEERSMQEMVRDITFFAKFISNAMNILKRVGSDSPETEKLSAECKDKLEKTSTLIRTLIKEAPDDVKALFLKRFFSLSQESMGELLSLLSELSRIKNYQLEKERSS